MPGSDTVPSTLSEKNAADDKLITVAYTFKNLTDEQRRAIYQALKDQPAGSAFNADIGTELPPSIELKAMPDALVAQVPQTKDYQFAVADNRVLLVVAGEPHRGRRVPRRQGSGDHRRTAFAAAVTARNTASRGG